MKHFIRKTLLHWRGRLVPEELELGWMPFLFLGYLAFLFFPSLFPNVIGQGYRDVPYGLLGPTLVSIAVFLPLYFLSYRSRGIRAVLCMLAIASLCLILLPTNAFANTYLIYAIAFAAFLDMDLWRRLTWVIAMLSAFLVEILVLRIPLFIFVLTSLIAIAVFFANHFQLENSRKRVALKLSHDEIGRLAALAERERIGRDLHDLLGHTLSLIALKSELAGKLLKRDTVAAHREIDEVTRVAREALSQVRRAVTGIRAAGLAAELASARQMLESDGVQFSYAVGEVDLQTEQETVLALVLREAATNIQRHARARHANAALEAKNGCARLSIRDDGNGNAIVVGNGLRGMRERVEAIGGRLGIESELGRGTRIAIDLPLDLARVGEKGADAPQSMGRP
ncbi:sensor histidine kinase [Dokdonella immobilis]|uniref:Two-component system, NarL family, sensor histidine kinase DesK n=1 Tax=Dokdonella immobilis TaxID=578942 RepID=A0A1I4V7C8_9GAMM|nr:sensor histidine kinase [Dokdonella immobilis]SFM96920.1 two-component system, NarL family, sensor histidine kinase DesK [Dokdonella immobilis]